MKVFVLNASMQYQVLNYRIPEYRSLLTARFERGQQLMLGQDMNIPQLESFIEQNRKYGMITVEEALNHKPGTPIVWIVNTEKAISQSLVDRVLNFNTGVITKIGQDMRRQAALATSHNMENIAHTPGAAKALEMSIEQVTGEDAGKMGEGIAVNADPERVGGDRKSAKRDGAKRLKV